LFVLCSRRLSAHFVVASVSFLFFFLAKITTRTDSKNKRYGGEGKHRSKWEMGWR
jgi:hypothetical protein